MERYLEIVGQSVKRRRLVIASIILNTNIIKKKYKKKRYWVSKFLEERYQKGAYYVTIPELIKENYLFTNYCRMNRTLFEKLLRLIAPHLEKKPVCRKAISAEERLLLTLRYLSSGDSMMSVKYQYYIAQPTISNIIMETCNVLWNILMPIVLKIPTYNDWKSIAENFERKCHFPHCLGAVDGKHVIVQAPPNSGSTYYNYKKSHSIVLMAICDSNYKFILVDIGAEGRQSDGGIWSRSVMGQAFLKGDLNIPAPDRVAGGRILPYVLVADEAFQLTNFMMRPFPGRENLTKDKKIYNYRHSSARRMVECTFGIVSSQWRIYKRPINTSIETTGSIVKATIVLHNFIIQNSDNHSRNIYINDVIEDGTIHNITAAAFRDIHNIGSNTNTLEAYEIRNRFLSYFNNEGMVPWQENML